jgi:daunorubicin resistance protein C
VSATAVTTRRPAAPRRARSYVVSDTLAMTWRNLLKYRRVPTLLVFSTIQPVMFVLLFAFVFGGAIVIPGVDYKNYLMPGIFVQTVVFGASQTGVALAEDLTRGMIDRFRSLPMARSAVLGGRTIGDSVRNLFVVLLMTAVGYAIGFRFQNGFANAVLAILITVAFGFAFSWISANIGLRIRDVESAQAASFIWIFPLVFASSAFVPIATMPGWLQPIAKVNPITITVNAVRSLTLGQLPAPVAKFVGLQGSTFTHVWQALAWIAGLLLVFVPLAIRGYRRAV